MAKQKWRELPGSRKRTKGITFCEGAHPGLEHAYGHYRVLQESQVEGLIELREREIATTPIYAKDLPPAERVLLETAVAAARVFEYQIFQNEEAR